MNRDITMPKVSIIIPVYNTEQYVERCIESLLKQTYENIELIIVDDASTDGSLLRCQKQRDFDSRIKVISLSNNAGVSYARNVGIVKSNGMYITFVDSDDCVLPNYIEGLVTLQNKYPNALAMCMLQGFTETPPTTINEDHSENEYKKDAFLTTQYLYHPWACASIFRKNIIEENNLRFTEGVKFAEDAYFVDKYLCFCEKVVISQMQTYCYYIRPDGGAINKLDKKYTANDVLSRYTSYQGYQEAIQTYREHSPMYLKAIEASYCFLAADILLMQTRAKYCDADLTNKLRRILAENLVYFLAHCRYRKHRLLVLGMRYMPNIVYKVLG